MINKGKSRGQRFCPDQGLNSSLPLLSQSEVLPVIFLAMAKNIYFKDTYKVKNKNSSILRLEA